jgi:hypothetical protein
LELEGRGGRGGRLRLKVGLRINWWVWVCRDRVMFRDSGLGLE